MSVPATTFIKNIRRNLAEPLSDAEILIGSSGSNWTNEEILEALNKSKDDAWDIIRSVREDYFQVTGATVSMSATVKEYTLATTFRQLQGLRITTSGYEYLKLRRVEQGTREFQETDALPLSNPSTTGELIYCIIETGGSSKIKFANYPPVALTLTYDYIKVLDDMTLSASSTIDIFDECRRFIEADATAELLGKNPEDKRFSRWEKKTERYEEKLKRSVSKRELRESSYVEPYNP